MSEAEKDLFGKIDALFEKRAPDALVDKGLEHEDFPLLTEVIGAARAAPVSWGGPERRAFERRASEQRREDLRGEDRRLGNRRQADQAEAPPPRPRADREEVKHLVHAMESRLSDLFIRQQLRLEEAVRKVVREELAKVLGDDGVKTPRGPRDA